jgi:hypothetical protein
MVDALQEWLRGTPNQPCIFGRIAAAADRISFCILTEADVAKGDDHIRDVIQRDRRIWKADAREGAKHAFIVAIISETLAFAAPDETLHSIATRLCDLYLFDQPRVVKRHDALVLKTNGGPFLKWFVGVNVFASQGDGRWWQDHRIPGGLAFSMNSVGHMARVFAERRFTGRVIGDATVDKLRFWALPTAMRVISDASKRPRFGTCLMERDAAKHCPVVPARIRDEVFKDLDEPARAKALGSLAGYSEHLYRGWYDTDESVPPAYFHVVAERPAELQMLPLYFTYLHSYTDEDYRSMGFGDELIDPEEAI